MAVCQENIHACHNRRNIGSLSKCKDRICPQEHTGTLESNMPVHLLCQGDVQVAIFGI
ncbi:MAG: hypothetical protein AB7S75_06600 [Desulfococcaceae bacterium]